MTTFLSSRDTGAGGVVAPTASRTPSLDSVQVSSYFTGPSQRSPLRRLSVQLRRSRSVQSDSQRFHGPSHAHPSTGSAAPGLTQEYQDPGTRSQGLLNYRK